MNSVQKFLQREWIASTAEQVAKTTTQSPGALTELAEESFIQNVCLSGKLTIDEIEILPGYLMMNVLQAMCDCPNLVQMQTQILSNPNNVNRVLKYYPEVLNKIITCFQWLETQKVDVASELVNNLAKEVNNAPKLIKDDSLLGYQCNMKLATFLVGTGYYVEAMVVLDILEDQVRDRSVHQLQRLRLQLLAESLSDRHEQTAETTCDIYAQISRNEYVPEDLMAGLNHALAVCHFERCEFGQSYQYGIQALETLDHQNCTELTVINVFRQLAKTCVAIHQHKQAKLLITQAVAWAKTHFGNPSVIYAETLEDYAFYLVMMNAYDDALEVHREASDIYVTLYGQRNLDQTVAQGNLGFGLYMRTFILRQTDIAAQQYVECVIALGEQLTSPDNRQLLAIKRVRALQAADGHREGSSCSTNVTDRCEPVCETMRIKKVRDRFYELENKEINLLCNQYL